MNNMHDKTIQWTTRNKSCSVINIYIIHYTSIHKITCHDANSSISAIPPSVLLLLLLLLIFLCHATTLVSFIYT